MNRQNEGQGHMDRLRVKQCVLMAGEGGGGAGGEGGRERRRRTELSER